MHSSQPTNQRQDAAGNKLLKMLERTCLTIITLTLRNNNPECFQRATLAWLLLIKLSNSLEER